MVATAETWPRRPLSRHFRTGTPTTDHVLLDDGVQNTLGRAI